MPYIRGGGGGREGGREGGKEGPAIVGFPGFRVLSFVDWSFTV